MFYFIKRKQVTLFFFSFMFLPLFIFFSKNESEPSIQSLSFGFDSVWGMIFHISSFFLVFYWQHFAHPVWLFPHNFCPAIKWLKIQNQILIPDKQCSYRCSLNNLFAADILDHTFIGIAFEDYMVPHLLFILDT